jgi:hypothetical protein
MNGIPFTPRKCVHTAIPCAMRIMNDVNDVHGTIRARVPLSLNSRSAPAIRALDGHDAHWFSDVAGAAFLGAGTTELLLYLHRQHEQQPARWRLFPDIVQPTADFDGPIKVSGLGATWIW